ncbi:hypothetical protein QT970_28600 [Microcoleus sp. herbarium8]
METRFPTAGISNGPDFGYITNSIAHLSQIRSPINPKTRRLKPKNPG